MGDAEELCIIHSLLCVIRFIKLLLFITEFIDDTKLAKRLLFEHHYGFWEVLLTEIHLDSISEERHPRLSTLIFLRLHRLHIRIGLSSCVSIRGFPGRLLGLIDHLLIGHSTAIFASWLCRTLSEGRKIGRIHLSYSWREFWSVASWHGHLMRRLSLWSLWLVLFAPATLSTIVTIVGSLLIMLLILFWSTFVTTTLIMRLGHVRPSAPTNSTERHASLLKRCLQELRVELTAN